MLYILCTEKSVKTCHKPATRIFKKVKLLYYVRYRLATLSGLPTLVFSNVGSKVVNSNIKSCKLLILCKLCYCQDWQHCISEKRAKTWQCWQL